MEATVLKHKTKTGYHGMVMSGILHRTGTGVTPQLFPEYADKEWIQKSIKYAGAEVLSDYEIQKVVVNFIEPLVLKKGESIKYLDYQIKNSENNDGLVLSKPNGDLWETHLGNFGIGTKENVDVCKKYALLHFMLARPIHFARIIAGRANGHGIYLEYNILENVCKKESIPLPVEAGHSTDGNKSILFNGKHLFKE